MSAMNSLRALANSCNEFKQQVVFSTCRMQGNYQHRFFDPYDALTHPITGDRINDNVVYGKQGKPIEVRQNRPMRLSPLNEFLRNAAAIVVKPIANTLSAIIGLLAGLVGLSIAAFNSINALITKNDDKKKSSSNLAKASLEGLALSAYFAVSIITDCLDSIVRLIGHSVASIISAPDLNAPAPL